MSTSDRSAPPPGGGDKRPKELFLKVLRLRAERLGVSLDEAPKANGRPLSRLAAEEAARRLNIEPPQVLAADLERMENSEYPAPECLTPDEIEHLVLIQPGSDPDWAEARVAHLESCEACETLVKATQPSLKHREQFKRFLDEKLHRTAGDPTSVSTSKWQSVLSLLRWPSEAPPPGGFAWASVSAAFLMIVLIAYSSFPADTREYVKAALHHPKQAWYTFLESIKNNDEQETERARQRLIALWNLDKLAGNLPDDPTLVKASVQSLKVASVRGLARPEKIAVAKRNIENKVKTSERSNEQAWRSYALELAGAETLARYETLRSGQTAPASLEELQVVDISVQNQIPRVTVQSSDVLDSNIKSLLQQSFAQTDGISRLDIYRENTFAYTLQRPSPKHKF